MPGDSAGGRQQVQGEALGLWDHDREQQAEGRLGNGAGEQG